MNSPTPARHPSDDYAMAEYQDQNEQNDHEMDEITQVVIDALEDAAFKGEWNYPADSTALVSAIQTAEIVVTALRSAALIVRSPR